MSDEQAILSQEKYMKYTDEQLGVGSFKNVYKCINIKTGLEYAWNEVNLEKHEAAFNAKIFQEIQMYKLCEHPNILKLYDHWFNDDNVLIFTTELLDNGSLYKYVQKISSYLTLSVLQKWLVQILNALNYLHKEKRIIHRDLKSGNVYIDAQTGLVKVGDLGLATLQDFKDVDMDTSNFAQSIVGTQGFMAPEIYTQTYDEKIDIFSFGMLLIELVTQEAPYSECKHTIQIYNKIREGAKPDAFNQIKNPILLDLINQAIEYDYTKRPSAAQLLQHEFFKTNFGNELVSQWVQKKSNSQPGQQSNSVATVVAQSATDVSPKKMYIYDQNSVTVPQSIPNSVMSQTTSGAINSQVNGIAVAVGTQHSSQIFQKSNFDRQNPSPITTANVEDQGQQKASLKKQSSYLNITVAPPADKAKEGPMVIYIRYIEGQESKCSKFIVEQNDTLEDTTSMLEDVIPELKQFQAKLHRILGQLFQDRENKKLRYDELYE